MGMKIAVFLTLGFVLVNVPRKFGPGGLTALFPLILTFSPREKEQLLAAYLKFVG